MASPLPALPCSNTLLSAEDEVALTDLYVRGTLANGVLVLAIFLECFEFVSGR